MIRRLRTVLLAALLLSSISQVFAHSVSVSHLDIEVPRDGAPLRIELDLSIRDLALTLPLDRNRDEHVTWGELLEARREIERLVGAGVILSSAGEVCELVPAGLATRRYDDGTYASMTFGADCAVTDGLRLDYTLLRERDPQHRALVTLRHEGEASAAITRGDPLVLLERGGSPGQGAARTGRSTWIGYLREGIHHILIGYDHLAFLLSLLLPAALLRRHGDWEPVADWRRSLGHVLGIVTAFTVAHSITLSLAALGWVTPASRWVEAAIAASVLLAALNNVRPLVTRRLWLVGFTFGLIHGFGFAGALGELGLPDGARLSALLGFNLGVELGQIAVVAAALPLLVLVRDRRWYVKSVMPLASLAIAALAAFWLWQRLTGA
jgi:hypothetical protein